MHMHKKAMKPHGKLVATKAGDKAVDDLNSESLDSAKTGKPFTPSATPPAAKEEAHASSSKKMSHHMAKKKAMAAKPSDTAAPADSATPPADSSGK